jgi:hypothetical protein
VVLLALGAIAGARDDQCGSGEAEKMDGSGDMRYGIVVELREHNLPG